MTAMVHAYRRFVSLAQESYGAQDTTKEDPQDPDVEILDKWVREVVTWMKDEGHSMDTARGPMESQDLECSTICL